MRKKARNMSMHADSGDTLPTMTPQELRTRKRFVGPDLAAIKALQALQPWMEAHVQEVVEEFYAHLLRFQQPLMEDDGCLAWAASHGLKVTPR
jgi:hypothetical protein